MYCSFSKSLCNSQFKAYDHEILHTYIHYILVYMYIVFQIFSKLRSLNFKIKASMELGLQNALIRCSNFFSTYYLRHLPTRGTKPRATWKRTLAGGATQSELAGGGDDVSLYPASRPHDGSLLSVSSSPPPRPPPARPPLSSSCNF